MNQTQWLRQVELLLRKSGLPAAYVCRTRAELADHLDSCRAADETLALLDEPPQKLAVVFIQNYRSQSFLRRVSPWLLLLLPLPIALFTTLLYYQACNEILCALFAPFEGNVKFPLHVTTTMWSLLYGGKLAVPLLSCLAIREIARRIARPWGWSAILFGLQCFASMVLTTNLKIAADSADLSLTANFSWESMTSVAQLFPGLAIGLTGYFFVRRLQEEQQKAVV